MVGLHNLVYGGIDTADYGIVVSGSESFIIPERDFTPIEIPGRNGDLIMDNGRFKNVEVPYYMFSDNKENIKNYLSTISQLRGYQKIVDSHHSNEYREGIISGTIAPEMTNINNRNGAWTVTFNCKPQRFILENGSKDISIAKNQTITIQPTTGCNEFKPLVTYIPGIFDDGNILELKSVYTEDGATLTDKIFIKTIVDDIGGEHANTIFRIDFETKSIITEFGRDATDLIGLFDVNNNEVDFPALKGTITAKAYYNLTFTPRRWRV